MLVGVDPVELGLAASLNRPGGDATGVSLLNAAVTAKRLELLHEMVPAATLIADLVNPTNRGTESTTRELQFAARVLGLDLMSVTASDPREIEQALATLIQQRVGALHVRGDPFFLAQRDQIVALAARYAVPSIYAWRDYTTAGGLVS